MPSLAVVDWNLSIILLENSLVLWNRVDFSASVSRAMALISAMLKERNSNEDAGGCKKKTITPAVCRSFFCALKLHVAKTIQQFGVAPCQSTALRGEISPPPPPPRWIFLLLLLSCVCWQRISGMEPEAPAKPREPTLPRRTGICNDNFPPKIAACVRPSRRTQRTAREKKKSRRKLSTGRLNRPSGAFFSSFFLYEIGQSMRPMEVGRFYEPS